MAVYCVEEQIDIQICISIFEMALLYRKLMTVPAYIGLCPENPIILTILVKFVFSSAYRNFDNQIRKSLIYSMSKTLNLSSFVPFDLV